MAAEVTAKTDWILLLQTMLNLASPLAVLATVLISYWWGKTRLQNSERELQSLKDSLSTQVTALRKQIQTLEAISPGQILEQYRTTIDLINNMTQDQIQTLRQELEHTKKKTSQLEDERRLLQQDLMQFHRQHPTEDLAVLVDALYRARIADKDQAIHDLLVRIGRLNDYQTRTLEHLSQGALVQQHFYKTLSDIAQIRIRQQRQQKEVEEMLANRSSVHGDDGQPPHSSEDQE